MIPAAETPGGEPRQYASRMRRATATEEQAPEKTRAARLSPDGPVP